MGEFSGDDAGLLTAESIKKSDSVETRDGVGGLGGKDKTGETEIIESAGKVRDKLSQIEADLSKLPPESIVERNELEAEKQEHLKWLDRYFDLNGNPRTSLGDSQKRKKSIEKNFLGHAKPSKSGVRNCRNISMTQ